MKRHSKLVFASILLLSCFAFISSEKESRRAAQNPNSSNAENVFVVDSVQPIFIKISAGGTFSLALKNDSTVWSWGNNLYGQLGCGNIKEIFFPVRVKLPAGIIDISAGPNHALALKSDGTVWSWGDNTFGQLGDGTKISNRIPAQIKQLANITSISAGGTYYMAYTNTTSGSGVYGLGPATSYSSYSQSAGISMALESDGTVWTWGSNSLIGSDNSTGYLIPYQNTMLTDIIAIAAGGFHSLALKSDGTVWAWGDNGFAQLGDDSHDGRNFPSQVLYLKNITAITASAQHSMALTADSLVWIWGDRPRIVNATREFHYVPEIMENLKGVIAISAGDHHNMALTRNGWVWTWGQNGSGQLGSGLAKKNQYKVRIFKVSALENVATISAGHFHSLALKKDGTIWAWGNNSCGQLGVGTKKNVEYATQIATESKEKHKKERKPAKPW